MSMLVQSHVLNSIQKTEKKAMALVVIARDNAFVDINSFKRLLCHLNLWAKQRNVTLHMYTQRNRQLNSIFCVEDYAKTNECKYKLTPNAIVLTLSDEFS